ncbi:hypothetical protein E2C01_032276 [Portunus trituberculatus]|uniref:Uncharacterized protein n=1 Tax=Portunus trituberculatus TaxID=210409 RepID=A0A5B7EVL1_PORTR|nr:hypothetical protein [Portunus trituberculatus]
MPCSPQSLSFSLRFSAPRPSAVTGALPSAQALPAAPPAHRVISSSYLRNFQRVASGDDANWIRQVIAPFSTRTGVKEMVVVAVVVVVVLRVLEMRVMAQISFVDVPGNVLNSRLRKSRPCRHKLKGYTSAQCE